MDESDLSEHMTLYRSRTGGSARPAVIAFGGISLGLGIPVFEFFRTLTTLGADALFVRDPFAKLVPEAHTWSGRSPE